MADEDRAHLDRLRRRPCCKCSRSAPSTAHHHTGRRAKGQRAHDHDAMPLCHECHMDLHGLTGVFKGWTRAQLQAWQDEQVARCRPADDVF